MLQDGQPLSYPNTIVDTLSTKVTEILASGLPGSSPQQALHGKPYRYTLRTNSVVFHFQTERSAPIFRP